MIDPNNDRDRLQIKKIVALAHWCNRNGRYYPAVRNVARAVNTNERRVRQILTILCAEGILLVQPAQRNHRLFKVNLDG